MVKFKLGSKMLKMEYSTWDKEFTFGEVMDLIPVGNSDLFFVPYSRHVEYSIFQEEL